MTGRLSIPELRELHKAQIIAREGLAIFDKLVSDRLARMGLLERAPDAMDELMTSGRRRYFLTAKGRAALISA